MDGSLGSSEFEAEIVRAQAAERAVSEAEQVVIRKDDGVVVTEPLQGTGDPTRLLTFGARDRR
jgi:hypothetical protein